MGIAKKRVNSKDYFDIIVRAERTIFLFYLILISLKFIKDKQLTHSCYPTLSDWVLALRYSLRYFLR